MTMLLFAAAAAAGCLPLHSDRILAHDVVAVQPAFAAVPRDVVLSLAPRPGLPRIFQPAELNQTLTRHDSTAVITQSVCFEWPLRRITSPEVQEAMLQSIKVDAGMVKVVELSRHLVPPGPLTFPMSGLRSSVRPEDPVMWKGFVTYAPGRKQEVWATAEISIPYTRVVAARDIRGGERLDASALRLDSGTGLPQDSDILTALDAATSSTIRRFVRAGEPLRTTMLKGVAAVSKGDVLHVDVLAGSAKISFQGTAMTNAEIGQLVAVQNPINRKTLRARVTASGRAVIGTGI